MVVRLFTAEQPLFAQRSDNGHLRVCRLQTSKLASQLRHRAVFADHDDLLKAVAAADLKVVWVVRGRDLQRAGTEVGLDVIVADDLQFALGQRQFNALADQLFEALVARIDCDGAVAEHRLRPHRRDYDFATAVSQRVGDFKERVGYLALLNLKVGDRRLAAWVPVDEVLIAVDRAVLVEVAENLANCPLVALVEREALALVVAGCAEAAELLDDRAAELFAPLPDALNECVAAKLFARAAFFDQFLFNLCLRGDPSVVCAEDPLRVLAAHAVEANQRVLNRAVERVAHVQRAGHVRRRNRNRVVLGGSSLRLAVEEPRAQPALHHLWLGLSRLEARLISEVRHGG